MYMITGYYTAYRGIANGADGSFDHFICQPDPFHLQYGYWRFQSVHDDRRAMASGYTTPEAVLIAAEESDTSFGQLDQVMLRWVRSPDDPHFTIALSGSASYHLYTIHELRDLLGHPMSSRGQIPLYPISIDVRLKEYWERKYSAQLSAPAQHRPRSTASPRNTGTRAAQHNRAHIAPRGPPPRASSNIGQTNGTARHQQQDPSQWPVHSSPGFFSSNAQATNNATARSFPPTIREHESRTAASIGAKKQSADRMPNGAGTTTGSHQNIMHSTFPQQKPPKLSLVDDYNMSQYRTPKTNPTRAKDAPLEPSPNIPLTYSTSSISGRPPALSPRGAESSVLTLSDMSAPTSTVPSQERIPTPIVPQRGEESSEVAWKSTRAGASPQIPSAPQCDILEQLSKLPCMDCGEEGAHKDDCNIGNFRPMTNLTILDYRALTDAVKQFDPGPYTTHFDQHPDAEPEDPQIQMAGIADVIRNEDSYKEDVELHNLPDDVMILLWALKTSDGVRVINEDEWTWDI